MTRIARLASDPRTALALVLALATTAAGPALAQGPRPAPEILRVGGLSGTPPVMRLSACATPAPAAAEVAGMRSALGRWEEEDAGFATGGTVRVAVHVLTSGGAGDVTDERLARLMGELDRAFQASGHRFELARVDRTEAPEWFRMAPGSEAEGRAKRALAFEPARHLNLYLCAPAAGWASYPWSAPEGDPGHGVVVGHGALVDGAAGDAAIHGVAHQVAHYLGLLEPDASAIATRGGPPAGALARLRSAATLYRPSLFAAPSSRAPGVPEISPTAGAEPEDGRVLSYRGAFPNPFRAETMLRFTIPASGPVSLRIYGVTGQLVRTLVDASLPPGDHSAMFRAGDLPSGAYFAVLRAGNVRMTRTLMLVR